MAETETLTIFLETRPRRDVGMSQDRDVETETTTLASMLLSLQIYRGSRYSQPMLSSEQAYVQREVSCSAAVATREQVLEPMLSSEQAYVQREVSCPAAVATREQVLEPMLSSEQAYVQREVSCSHGGYL